MARLAVLIAASLTAALLVGCGPADHLPGGDEERTAEVPRPSTVEGVFLMAEPRVREGPIPERFSRELPARVADLEAQAADYPLVHVRKKLCAGDTEVLGRFADGRAFGLAGPYEELRGTVYLAADPASAADRRVVDLDKAPREADGKVRYRADFSTTPEAFAFPAIPGVTPPGHAYVARRLDYGPRFASEGVIGRQPPAVGEAFAVRVPIADADGNDVGGLRLPEVRVPLATYASWNLRDPADGGEGELCILAGSFFPFRATRAEREAAGDPRPSVEERYGSREEYVGRYAEAALKLIREGYLLAEDLPAMVEHAGALWNLVAGEDNGAEAR